MSVPWARRGYQATGTLIVRPSTSSTTSVSVVTVTRCARAPVGSLRSGEVLIPRSQQQRSLFVHKSFQPHRWQPWSPHAHCPVGPIRPVRRQSHRPDRQRARHDRSSGTNRSLRSLGSERHSERAGLELTGTVPPRPQEPAICRLRKGLVHERPITIGWLTSAARRLQRPVGRALLPFATHQKSQLAPFPVTVHIQEPDPAQPLQLRMNIQQLVRGVLVTCRNANGLEEALMRVG